MQHRRQNSVCICREKLKVFLKNNYHYCVPPQGRILKVNSSEVNLAGIPSIYKTEAACVLCCNPQGIICKKE